jgi:hypothetical protein
MPDQRPEPDLTPPPDGQAPPPQPSPIQTTPPQDPTTEVHTPMLDVHPPHQAVHTWKDFFIHIATIAVGLLIAIGLEQTVEYFHHRHLLHQARENIREELTENLAILKEDRKYLESNRRTLIQNLATLSDVKIHPKQPHPPIVFPWQWNSPSYAAWQTAKDTGTLALMPYDQAQNLSMLYRQQDLVTDKAIVYVTDTNSAAVPLKIHQDVSQLSPELLDEMIHGCATTISDIEYLEGLMDSLEHAYRINLDRM